MTPEQRQRYAAQFNGRAGQSLRTVRRTGQTAVKTPREQFTPGPSNLARARDFAGGVTASASSFITGRNFRYDQERGGITLEPGASQLSIPKGISSLAINAYQGVKTLLDPVAKFATGSYNADLDRITLLNQVNTKRLEDAFNLHKSGRMTKERYGEVLREINEQGRLLSEEQADLESRIAEDRAGVLKGAVNTVALILSGGRYAPLKTVVAGTGVKGAGITKNILFAGGGRGGQALIKLEDAAAKIPSVRALMVRNGAQFSRAANRGAINQSLRDAAAGALIKQPFVYHYTIEDISDVMRDLDQGELNKTSLGKVAFTATLALDGGVLGAAWRNFKKAGASLRLAAKGRDSLLDNLSSRFRGGNPAEWIKWLGREGSEGYGQRLKDLRVMQEMNLRRWGGASEAADSIGFHVSSNGAVDISKMTFSDFMEREQKYLRAFEEIDALAKSGKILDAAGNPVAPGKVALGTFDRAARDQLVETLAGKTFMERVQYLESLKDQGIFWAQNEIMFNRVYGIVAKTDDMAEVSKALKGIDTQSALRGLPKDVARRLGKDGYVAITPKGNLSQLVKVEDTRKLITGVIEKGDEVFDATVKPMPGLSFAYGGIKRAGLSAEGANKVAYRKLSENVAANLDQLAIAKNFTTLGGKYATTNITKGGKAILDILQDYATSKRPARIVGAIGKTNAITDIRQLTLREIGEALGSPQFRLSREDSKKVAEAIMDGYNQLPLELRGLGDRAVDKLFKYVPGFKVYNRTQGALRYTYNPFFRIQEVVETKILSKMKSGNLLWRKPRAELDRISKRLDDTGMFSTGFSGEGARDDVVLGRITANITKFQKRDLAGLASKLADKRGITIDDMIINHFDELEDALKVIVQYPSRGIISSPLARTINLAFFPMRYNLKVAGLAAQVLARQSPVVQYSVISGIMDAGEWLKSDEGLVWQSENSEAIGLLRWITPYFSVESVINMLNGRVDSISDMGMLGGLPAGVIFQMLDGQGAFENLPAGMKWSTPYVNPKTGEVFSDKIPVTLKGKAAIALGDFINSTFTYPGRIVGLPGKGAAIKSTVGFALRDSYKDYEFEGREDELTDLQRRQSEILKTRNLDDLTHDELLTLYESPTGVGFSVPNLPLLVGTPKLSTLTKRTDIESLPSGKRSRSGRKKKTPKTARPIATR